MEGLIDRNTAAIVLTIPSNPCGSVFSKHHILEVIQLCEKYRIPIIADEIYEHFVFPNIEYHSISSLSKNVPVLSCGGLTKRFLVPGWRLGWITMHDRHDIFHDIRKVLSNLSTRILGSNTIVQGALPDILANTPQSFFDGLVQTLHSSLEDIKSKHDKLLEKITESRTDAFNALVEICNSNFWDAADFLASFKKPELTENNGFGRVFGFSYNQAASANVEKDGHCFSVLKRKSIENISLELYTEIVDAKINVKKAVQFCSRNIRTYPMKSKNGGVLFLVNIIEIKNRPDLFRRGAILDKKKLIALFREFGFKIFYYENISLKEFLHLVDELIESKCLKATDSLVFSVLSHGFFKDGHQVFQFSDGNHGSVEDVIVKFSNKNCPYMRAKPKVFIFPMCRGISTRMKFKTFGVPSASGDNLPAFSDIKICYGSVKGFYAFRDETIGSWYIHHFCEIMASFAHIEHFNDLLILIGQSLESYSQLKSNGPNSFVQIISSEDIGFLQHLFFNPGFYG